MGIEINLDKALTDSTRKVFDAVSKMECIKDLYLCGGTAQALLLNHRKSEDLDFELIGIHKERPELNISAIANEIEKTFKNNRMEILGEDHYEFYIEENVKLSFYRPQNNVPTLNPGLRYNNITTPSPQELLGMKVYVLTQRLTYRDYYDIAVLLDKGINLHDAIKYALDFSKHELHAKDVIQRLLSPALYRREDSFLNLNPQYDLTSEDIKDLIKQTMIREFQQNDKPDKIFKSFRNSTLTQQQEKSIKAYQTYKSSETNTPSEDNKPHL